MRHKLKKVSWLTILIAFNIGFLAINGLAAWKIYWFQPPQPTLLEALTQRPYAPQAIEYKDFISIMLTGLSAMITVLGIGLATVAIWGYSRLNEDATAMGEKAARESANQALAAWGRDRMSADDARARLEKIPELSPAVVQSLVDAFVGDGESGRASATPSLPGEDGNAPNR